jgi:aryl-alcohol dehydrogenase-like predicted oxidoreductase
VANDFGLDPVQMALAWCRTRPFPVIPIIGATSLPQLETALGAAELALSTEVVAAIEAAYRATPMPY